MTTAIDLDERTFQSQHVVPLLEQLGWRVQHHRPSWGGRKQGHATTYWLPGWPDLYAYGDGNRGALFIEVKAERGRVDARQAAVHRDLRAAGQTVLVVRPSDLDALARYLACRASQGPGPAARLLREMEAG